MATGMVYNMFVCFVTGFTGLVVFRLLRKIREEKERKYSQGIDYFCLFFGLVWVLTGLGVLFVWLGRLELDDFVFKWFTSPLIYIHLLPGFYYFGWSFFKNKENLRLFFDGLFTVIAVLTIFTFWRYGFVRSEITYWGSTLVPNELTNNLFTYGMFVPIFLCIIIELVRRWKRWKETGDHIERRLFGFNLGFFVYAITGFFDALASAQGWLMLLARIGSMLPPLIFYFFATLSPEE